jgi:hypothetical protein
LEWNDRDDLEYLFFRIKIVGEHGKETMKKESREEYDGGRRSMEQGTRDGGTDLKMRI